MSEDFRGLARIRISSALRPARGGGGAVDGATTEIPVRLSARFEPLEGRLRWAGRAAPDPALVEAYRAGAREATIAIAGGDPVPARLGEPDPWGGLRLTGTGFPPWPDFG